MGFTGEIGGGTQEVPKKALGEVYVKAEGDIMSVILEKQNVVGKGTERLGERNLEK